MQDYHWYDPFKDYLIALPCSMWQKGGQGGKWHMIKKKICLKHTKSHLPTLLCWSLKRKSLFAFPERLEVRVSFREASHSCLIKPGNLHRPAVPKIPPQSTLSTDTCAARMWTWTTVNKLAGSEDESPLRIESRCLQCFCPCVSR